MRIHAAIVEDEPEAAETLKQCLQQFGQQANISIQASYFPTADLFMRPYRPVYDVVFMDIRMPGLDGMTAAQQLRSVDAVVPLVFVTSMVQFAVKGYEVDALDFIVKPVRYPAFQIKMRRILQAIEAQHQQGVLVHVDGSDTVVPVSQIHFIEVSNHYLTYHTGQGDYTVRGKLTAAEQQLPADSFFRVSAAYLIHLRYVDRVYSEDVEVAGTLIRISRTKKKDLMAALAAYLGKEV